MQTNKYSKLLALNMPGKIERLLKSIFVTKRRWYSLKPNTEIKLSLMNNHLVGDSLT